jgi:cytochrome P450
MLIPGGSQAALLVAAGNRDPRHYERPDVFDITRNPTDHLTFGYGTHACAGQGLARLEAHAILTAVVRHFSGFTLGATDRSLHNITRPYSSIEVTSVELA